MDNETQLYILQWVCYAELMGSQLLSIKSYSTARFDGVVPHS